MTDYNYTVSTEAQLNAAIAFIDQNNTYGASAPTYTITLAADITLDSDLDAIDPTAFVYSGSGLVSSYSIPINVTINGGGHTIDGNDAYRGLMVLAGNVTVSELTITDAAAIGGTGGAGLAAGGGGAGLGGGLFIASGASVTLNNVNFTNDTAKGGTGGTSYYIQNHPTGAGGGGGMGGDGGFGGIANSAGGGGGLGRDAHGQSGQQIVGSVTTYQPFLLGGDPRLLTVVPVSNNLYGFGVNAGSGIAIGQGSAGSGGSRTIYSYAYVFGTKTQTGSRLLPGGAGAANGGGGGAGYFNAGGGGGIFGSTPSHQYGTGTTNNSLNAGGFGGGGGGGYFRTIRGGTGGFGGGGGGSEGLLQGGNGGFGGGGGGGYTGGLGGFGAGNGSGSPNSVKEGSGGGGLGAGGAIFVQQGGTLTFNSGSISSGSATGGAGGPGASSGSGFGSGIFYQSDSSNPGTMKFSPTSGNTLEIDDVITDEKGSISTYAGAGSVSLDIGGAGTVTLAAANSYTGATTIEAGATLVLTGSLSQLGGNIVDNGTLVLEQSANTSFSHHVSGSGIIRMASGSGATVTLADLSSYSGSFIIDAGTLSLTGAQTTIADLSGSQGTLAFGSNSLTFGTSIDTTFSGNLSQSGTLIKQGSGTTSLSGTLSGAITIASGAIDLTGSGTAFSGGIEDDATLILGESGTLSLGPVFGTGAIISNGTGSATILGGSTFSGLTTITSGTLVLAGNVSGWSGAIANSSALVFTTSGTTSFTPSISGSGSLELAGSGTLTLLASETISGAVAISSGTLRIAGDSANFGSSIHDDSRLVFAQSSDSSLNDVVSGIGTLVQAGASILTLNAVELLTGTVEVDSGALRLGTTANLAAASTLSVQGGTFDLNNHTTHVHDLIGNGGTIDLGTGTLAADAIAVGFNTNVIGSGVLVAGDGATIDNHATLTNLGFGANGSLINAAGITIDTNGTIAIAGPGVILGSVTTGADFSLTNGGTIDGRVSLASGSITNGQYFNTNAGNPANWTIQQAGLLAGGVTATDYLSLTNAGTIQSGVTLDHGTITNAALVGPGTITPSTIIGGVTATNSLVLSNAGVLTGGITAGASSTITNVANAFIQLPSNTTSHGTISGAITLGAGSTVDNSGTISNGIVLQAGGTVYNRDIGFGAGASHIGSVTLSGNGLVDNRGVIGDVSISNGATLSNAAADSSITGVASIGVGGYLTNSMAGVIASVVDAGTVVNNGIVTGAATILAGGLWTQQGLGQSFGDSVGYLTDFGTVINKGLLQNGVSVGAGGLLTNEAGAQIGAITVAGSVTNYGAVDGVLVQSTGSFINHAVMNNGVTDNGTFTNDGYLHNAVVGIGGTFTNLAAGTVSGYGIVNGGTMFDAGKINADITVQNQGLLDIKSGGNVASVDVINGGTLEVETGGVVGSVNLNGGILLATGGTANSVFATGNSLIEVGTPQTRLFVQGDAGTRVEFLAGQGTLSAGLFSNFGRNGIYLVDAGANWTVGGGGNGNYDLSFSGAGTLSFSSTLSDHSISNATTLNGNISTSGGLTNQLGGVLTGVIQVGSELLDNAGRITGTATAISGPVINETTGTISTLTVQGSTLTNLGSIDTVLGAYAATNSGTIGSISALSFDNSGKVTGAVSARNIVNEASGTIANISYLTSSLTNFGTIGSVSQSSGTLINNGLINGSVQHTGGTVTNAAGATITGALNLINANAASTVTNNGLIEGDVTISGGSTKYDVVLVNTGTIEGTVFDSGGTIDNYGTIQTGVSLSDAGGLGYLTKLIFEDGSSISGAITGTSNIADVLEFKGKATASSVTQFGTIEFDPGASVTLTGNSTFNHLTNLRPATVVTGSGTLDIAGTLTNGVSIAAGIAINIEAAGTLINQGTIKYSTAQVGGPGQVNGVKLVGDNAVLINQTNAIVTGGVTVSGTGATVSDSGTITGGLTFSGENETLMLGAGASIDSVTTNADRSTALELGGSGNLQTVGINLASFGSIILDAGANWSIGGNLSISQQTTLAGTGTLTVAGTLTNSSILHDSPLLSGGTILNQSAGVITGLAAKSSTIVNAGSIGGGVSLSNATLFNQQGATVSGLVSGGTLNDSGILDTVTIANGTLVLNAGFSTQGIVTGQSGSVLDLAGNGTLDGLGAEFIGFETIETDGNWTLGAASLSGHTTLTGSGTLTATALSESGTLVNESTLDGNITVTSGGTFINDGVLLGSVQFSGSGGRFTNEASGTISGGVTVSGSGQTITAQGSIGGNGITLLGLGETLVLDTDTTPAATAISGNGDILQLAGSHILSGLGVSLTGFDTISLAPGASWQLGVSNTLSQHVELTGATTLSLASYGDLTNTASQSFDLALQNNAHLTNQSGATINGSITLDGANAGVIDDGTITGSIALNGSGERVVLGGSAVVTGGITGASDGSSTIELTGTGGTLHLDGIGFNGSGIIQVDAGSDWVLDGTLAAGLSLTLIGGGTLNVTGLVDNGSITNQTTLSGTLSIGDGGTLINQGTASGVDLSGAATLDNQGIIGSGNTSVDFTGSGGRLIEHVGASINGSVIGNAQSTLELFGTYQLTQRYSGVDGSTYFVQIYNGVSGIGGLGTQITNFGTITVDQGQAWELTGSNTIDAGVSLVNNGLLIVDNPLLVRGSVINNGHAGNYATYLYTGSDSSATQVTGGIEGSITVDVGGSLTNNGVLGGHHDGDGVTLTGGSLTNAQGASIEGNGYGVAIAGSGAIRNAGSISIPSGYYQNSQGNYHLRGIAPVGITNTIQSGDTVSGYGLINTINGDNNGVIRASGGTLEIAAAVTGTGRLEIAANSTLRLDAATSEAIVFDRSGPNDRLVIAPSNASGQIEGFVAGDTISLGVLYGSLNLISESPDDTFIQILDSGGSAVGELDLAGDYLLSNLHLDTDGNLTTTQELPCYCPGTLIRTIEGDVPVEDLVIGNEVLTHSGAMRPIKWIGRRSYAARFILGRKDVLPICFETGSLGDRAPIRDLWVSPHHAIYLDGLLIEAKDLINDISIYQADVAEEVSYFHIELETHDVILADGAWAESFLDNDSRTIFHNAQEFALLYPEADRVQARKATRYYAPRIADGPLVEAIRYRLMRRASPFQNVMRRNPT